MLQITSYIFRCHAPFSWEADDIASQAVMTAWQKTDSLQDESKFIPWIKGIARNIVLKKCAHAKQLSVVSRNAFSGNGNDESPEEIRVRQEEEGFDDESILRSIVLDEARATLSQLEQNVIRLRFDDQYSSAEVAKMLNISDDNVRQISPRACRKMLSYLELSDYADLFCKAPFSKK